MPHLRIAKITYDHHPLEFSDKGMSIGEQIDRHIHQTILDGSLVSEVSLFFETEEEQHKLVDAYRNGLPIAAKKAR
jgi:hypothetical protein